MGSVPFNPSLPRENVDAQAASTDGRTTFNMDDETHMFVKRCNKKQRGGFKYKKKPSIFSLFLPKAVFCLPRVTQDYLLYYESRK
jgi:hypothetical protein